MRINYVVFGSTSGRGITCFWGSGHRPTRVGQFQRSQSRCSGQSVSDIWEGGVSVGDKTSAPPALMFTSMVSTHIFRSVQHFFLLNWNNL